MRFPAAVKAMSIAVFIDVIFALSIRVKESRWVCASTTAILLQECKYEPKQINRLPYIGTPISCACCSAACMATLAPFCVRLGIDIVAAAVGAMSSLQSHRLFAAASNIGPRIRLCNHKNTCSWSCSCAVQVTGLL
jgi:hypothetical protein